MKSKKNILDILIYILNTDLRVLDFFYKSLQKLTANNIKTRILSLYIDKLGPKIPDNDLKYDS